MNIIERGRKFLHSLRALANRTAWDWRRCPTCGDTLTCKWGSYTRQPWFLAGRQDVRVQRHWCDRCHATYSETSALLIRGSWYAREVHRSAIDLWQHVGTSTRRAAELLRSWLGHQERWLLWRPLDPPPVDAARCHLSASTIERWLDRAGQRAQQGVADQLAGVPSSGQVGTDGLWVRLRGGGKRVVLCLVDSVSGLLWPPVVATGEAAAANWEAVFARAKAAGLCLAALRGVVSDGAAGLSAYLEATLTWVSHQRCVFHLWRGLVGEIATRAAEAATGLAGDAAKQARDAVWRELTPLIHAVLDAPTGQAAHRALAILAAHPRGARLAALLDAHLDAALTHLLAYNAGLCRVTPEWCWRDFRLPLGRGRNQGSEERVERAALVWAIYHNFTPAQERSERKRSYPHAGLCPLARAGVPPNGISYLDALGV
jgi:hypothetical protein